MTEAETQPTQPRGPELDSAELDGALVELLAEVLSIESAIVELGGETERVSDALFALLIERSAPLPYDPRLNELIYEGLRYKSLNEVFERVGEEGVKALLELLSSSAPSLEDVEEREAILFALVDEDEEEKLLSLVDSMEAAGFPRHKVLSAVWAHILNRALRARTEEPWRDLPGVDWMRQQSSR